MRGRGAILALAVLLCGIGGWVPMRAAQKPHWIPVELTYSVPPGLKSGDEVTTVFTFTTTFQVPKLEIKLTPLEGLAWLEGEKHTTFESIGKGQERQVRVKLRLTGAKGELSLVMLARYGDNTSGDSVIVQYGGTSDAATGRQ